MSSTPRPAATALAGRVAVVTGAGRGIGRATALELARQGACVVVNDLGGSLAGDAADAEPARVVAAEIEAAGGQARANNDSVANWPAAQRIIQTALDAFGRIDLLVNSAGLSIDAPIGELDPEVFDRVVRSHLHGAFHCLRAAAPHMQAAQFGRVVNLVSRAGLLGIPATPAYGSAKGGVFGLTNVASLDLAEFGITVNAVSPAATETRMVTNAIEALSRQDTASTERARGLRDALQAPERVACVIAALCLDSSAAVNGQIVYVDKERVGFFQPLALARSTSLEPAADVAAAAAALEQLEPHARGGIYES
jgi:NAD(P)-dependent dehydrogenase (short-subunit alcohol dehydrogenase family)